MKTTVMVLALTCGCIASAYSQINLNLNRNREGTADSVSIPYHAMNLTLGHMKAIKPNDIYDLVTGELFFSNDIARTSRMTLAQYNMPCVEPQGVFSMRVIKPDSTITYPMLIKRY